MAGFTQKGKLLIAQQGLNLVNSTQLKLILVDDTYMHDDARDLVDDGTLDDVASREIAVVGYVGGFGGSGRRVPSTRTLTRYDAEGKIQFGFADETWAQLAAGVTIGGVALILEGPSRSHFRTPG